MVCNFKNSSFADTLHACMFSFLSVEGLTDTPSTSCTYADHYGIAGTSGVPPGVPPQPGGMAQGATNVRQKLREKLANNKGDGT